MAQSPVQEDLCDRDVGSEGYLLPHLDPLWSGYIGERRLLIHMTMRVGERHRRSSQLVAAARGLFYTAS